MVKQGADNTVAAGREADSNPAHVSNTRHWSSALAVPLICVAGVLGMGEKSEGAEPTPHKPPVPATARDNAPQQLTQKEQQIFNQGVADGIKTGRLMGNLDALVTALEKDSAAIDLGIRATKDQQIIRDWDASYREIRDGVKSIRADLEEGDKNLTENLRLARTMVTSLGGWNNALRLIEKNNGAAGAERVSGVPAGNVPGSNVFEIRHGDIISLKLWDILGGTVESHLKQSLDKLSAPAQGPAASGPAPRNDGFDANRQWGNNLRQQLREEGRRLGRQLHPQKAAPSEKEAGQE